MTDIKKLISTTRLFLIPLTCIIMAAGCASVQDTPRDATLQPERGPTSEVILASDVEWEHLNPARGAMSPKAGTLWGDRNGTEPTGFLVEFVDGFSSPPHIHNVSYRGVVIHGLVHNDDPDAAHMWMPTGSFWTQPKGETHITAARGDKNVAYIEIEGAPYLVLPAEESFDGGERPINIDESNIVWLDASSTTWIEPPTTSVSADGPAISFLWGNGEKGQLNGSLIKLPSGFHGTILGHGSTFRAVVIQGNPTYAAPGETGTSSLEPGSYFSAAGESAHRISCDVGGECVIYVRTDGNYDVIPTEPQS